MILFDCPRCLHNLRVAKDQSGSRIDCPKCKVSLTVPSQSADAGLFDDLFDSPAAPSSVESKPSKKQPSKKRQSKAQPQPKPQPAQAKPEPAVDNPLADLVDEQTRGTNPVKNKPSVQADDSNPLAGLVIPGSPEAKEPDPDVGKDPFKVDPDAPLKVDGVGDIFSNTDVFGIKCHICDTRIHVRPKQIGTEVACPICFSKVKVRPPEAATSLRWEDQQQEKDSRKSSSSTAKSHIAPDEELKLSAPIERPKVEIDPSWGLAPVEDDLLAPKPKTIDQDPGDHTSKDEVPELIVVNNANNGFGGPAPQDGDLLPPSKGKRKGKKKPGNKSSERSEKKANSNSPATTGTTGTSGPMPQPSSATLPSQTRSVESSGVVGKDFPEFGFAELLGSAIAMIKSPGVLLRVGVAFALMCLGAITMEWISPEYHAVDTNEESTMLARLIGSAQWIFAAGIYLFGLAVLWWTSSYLFRDAALGKRTVASWSNAGTNEVLSTFLLFAFGFFIGGLPAAFFGLVILPLRVLLGPLFLLSAWYNQSPFSIVSVDAFQSASQNSGQWTRFYIFVGGLAFLGFVAGLIFWMRALLPFVAGLPLIIFGIIICIVVTLLFAVVCGWHCGRVVESLENLE